MYSLAISSGAQIAWLLKSHLYKSLSVGHPDTFNFHVYTYYQYIQYVNQESLLITHTKKEEKLKFLPHSFIFVQYIVLLFFK